MGLWWLRGASLRGNALRSLEQFKGTLVHAVWYFARGKKAKRSYRLSRKATGAHARAEADRVAAADVMLQGRRPADFPPAANVDRSDDGGQRD